MLLNCQELTIRSCCFVGIMQCCIRVPERMGTCIRIRVFLLSKEAIAVNCVIVCPSV